MSINSECTTRMGWGRVKSIRCRVGPCTGGRV